MADFQVEYEGSIPFIRSKHNNRPAQPRFAPPDLPNTTGGTARFTTSRMAKLDWIRATRGKRESSVR
jgi:hypothetical protein